MTTNSLGLRKKIAEGKTKVLFAHPGIKDMIVVHSKDDVTAGDGAKHDLLPGKGAWATTTTCNVFRLLKACGIPVAFGEQLDATHFSAPECAMLPYEVVIRREAHGSFVDRNPHMRKGEVFPQLVLEFFCKTSGGKWRNHDLPKDDPLLAFTNGQVEFYYPGHNAEERKTAHKGALVGQAPFLTVPEAEFFTQPGEKSLLAEMGRWARKIFLILEKAWNLQDKRIVDFKIEFGLDPGGNLVVADVIDSDSWRLVGSSGGYECKQAYREGAPLDQVAEKYASAAMLTGRFTIPTQRLILWRGSKKDEFTASHQVLEELSLPAEVLRAHEEVTCSVHKQPERACQIIRELVRQVPNTVVVSLVGMSNAASPTLSAQITVPVIAVTGTFDKFPDDVWSSLRAPSFVPCSTIPGQANAILHALQILGMNNPGIYAALRFEQEKRMIEE